MSLLLTDFIRVIDNAIPEALCEELIRRFDQSPHVYEGKVGTEKGEYIPEFRSCLELNIMAYPGFEDLQPYLFRVLQVSTDAYQRSVQGSYFPQRYAFEQLRMKRYRAGGGHIDQFRDHVDVDSASSAKRFLACFYYLNDVSCGGETRFPYLAKDIEPRRGRVVMFPPMWNYVHSGEIPISGDKYLLGSYLQYLD